MKKIAIIVFLFFYLYSAITYGQTNHPEFKILDSGIIVEKIDSSNTDKNKYSNDNKIYKIGRKFTYSYYHQDKNNRKFLFTGAQSNHNKYQSRWDFSAKDAHNINAVSTIVLKVVDMTEQKIFFGDDYNQTVINYTYYTPENIKYFSSENTGVIENIHNVWMHPPRSYLFMILELNPFPYIKAPYNNGNKWKWNLKIGNHYADKRWKYWEGQIENRYKYEITGVKDIPTKIGTLKCYVIESHAESRIGKTFLTSYFNEMYGFVKLDYVNIDGTKLIMDIEKFEDAPLFK